MEEIIEKIVKRIFAYIYFKKSIDSKMHKIVVLKKINVNL